MSTTLNNQLAEASKNGDLEKVKYLVENGADIHANDDNAFFSSAVYGHLNVVKYLVDNGANQSKLFELWNNQKIVNIFFDIPDCNPDKKHTDELCSDSFELPNKGD